MKGGAGHSVGISRSGDGGYELRAACVVEAPLAEVFDFFSHPRNLAEITPAEMGFEILGDPPAEVREGLLIDYRVRVAGLPLRWRTLIRDYEPGRRFVDVQLRGPYRSWEHEHRFAADGAARTRMTDRVVYRLPFGPLGRVAHSLFVAAELRKIFDHRAAAIGRRFPEAGAGERD